MVSLDNEISEVCIETYWFLSCREADGVGEQRRVHIVQSGYPLCQQNGFSLGSLGQ